MNHKRLFRLYREMRLMVRRRGGRKRALGTRAPMLVPQWPNDRWSLIYGRRMRVLAVVDDWTRESLALVNETLFRSLPHARALDAWRAGLPAASFAARLAKPRHLRCAGVAAVRGADPSVELSAADRPARGLDDGQARSICYDELGAQIGPIVQFEETSEGSKIVERGQGPAKNISSEGVETLHMQTTLQRKTAHARAGSIDDQIIAAVIIENWSELITHSIEGDSAKSVPLAHIIIVLQVPCLNFKIPTPHGLTTKISSRPWRRISAYGKLV